MNFRKGVPVAVVILGCFLLWPKYPQIVSWILGLILIMLLLNSWDTISALITQ